ncbi:hypothetical protein [Micromonospora sp. NPDC005806]|uniref:hypothetical protein n=1 Tax=Micromonospora sp. NPDC005806 TaxID=3364234 RepID=UPI0036C9B635
MAGKAALKLNDHWSRTGKWLLRELREFSPGTAAEWLAVQGNPDAILDYGRRLLARHGGPLFEGYHAKGDMP